MSQFVSRKAFRNYIRNRTRGRGKPRQNYFVPNVLPNLPNNRISRPTNRPNRRTIKNRLKRQKRRMKRLGNNTLSSNRPVSSPKPVTLTSVPVSTSRVFKPYVKVDSDHITGCFVAETTNFNGVLFSLALHPLMVSVMLGQQCKNYTEYMIHRCCIHGNSSAPSDTPGQVCMGVLSNGATFTGSTNMQDYRASILRSQGISQSIWQHFDYDVDCTNEDWRCLHARNPNDIRNIFMALITNGDFAFEDLFTVMVEVDISVRYMNTSTDINNSAPFSPNLELWIIENDGYTSNTVVDADVYGYVYYSSVTNVSVGEVFTSNSIDVARENMVDCSWFHNGVQLNYQKAGDRGELLVNFVSFGGGLAQDINLRNKSTKNPLLPFIPKNIVPITVQPKVKILSTSNVEKDDELTDHEEVKKETNLKHKSIH